MRSRDLLRALLKEFEVLTEWMGEDREQVLAYWEAREYLKEIDKGGNRV